MAYFTATVLDEFKRSSLGSNWTNSGLTIKSDQLAAEGSEGAASWNKAKFGPNCEAWVEWGALEGVGVDILESTPGSNTYYELEAGGNGDWGIIKSISGTRTTLKSGKATFAEGDSLGLRREGSKLIAIHKHSGTESVLGEVEDSSITEAGYAGAYMFGSTRVKKFAAGSIGTSYEGFSAYKPPPSTWRPFSATTSPWNAADAETGTLHSESAAIIARLFEEGPVANLVVGASTAKKAEWNHPLYFPTTLDLEYTVVASKNKEWYGKPETLKVRLPTGAKPAAAEFSGESYDHHMCAVEESGREVDMFYVTEINESTKTIHCTASWESSITDNGNTNVATAAGFSLPAGFIRAEEWKAGEINHALFTIVKGVSSGISYPAKNEASKRHRQTAADRSVAHSQIHGRRSRKTFHPGLVEDDLHRDGQARRLHR